MTPKIALDVPPDVQDGLSTGLRAPKTAVDVLALLIVLPCSRDNSLDETSVMSTWLQAHQYLYKILGRGLGVFGIAAMSRPTWTQQGPGHSGAGEGDGAMPRLPSPSTDPEALRAALV